MRGRPTGPFLAAMMTLALPLGAQEGWTRATDEDCDRGDRDRERVCEVRTRSFGATGQVEVDGGRNGGIVVEGWDGDEVRVTARVRANARSERRADELVASVRLMASGGRLSADGPRTERGEGWHVTWEIQVPRRQDLRLDATNGGLAVRGVEGRMELETTNGGVRLEDVGGDVRARTTNGGLDVRLDGGAWRGAGLDAQTTNGGVDLRVPEGYSAELDAGTTNGGFDLGFPVRVSGRLGRTLRATLGDGGPPVRVVTTNGGVRIRRP